MLAPRSATRTATVSNCGNGLGEAGCRRPAARAILTPSNALVGGIHAELHAGQLQDLPLGTALGNHLAREGDAVRAAPYRAGQPAGLVSRDLAAQESAGADRGRHDLAVRVERDQRVSRRDDRAAAASRRPGPTRPQPRLDRLRP